MTRSIDTSADRLSRYRSFTANWIPGAAESRSLRRRLMAVLRLSCQILCLGRKRHLGVLGGNGGACEPAAVDLAGARRPAPALSWALSAVMAVAAVAGSASSASAASKDTEVSGGNNIETGADKATATDSCITMFDRNNPGSQEVPFEGTANELGVCATAVGAGADASESAATALGSEATAKGALSIAIGGLSSASASSTVAIGPAAQALGTYSLAMGRQAVSDAPNSMALGPVRMKNPSGRSSSPRATRTRWYRPGSRRRTTTRTGGSRSSPAKSARYAAKPGKLPQSAWLRRPCVSIASPAN